MEAFNFPINQRIGVRSEQDHPRQHVDLFLSSEKGKRGLNKLRLGVEEDRSVAAMGHDPERRTEYGAIHFHCHLNWIEKVAVAADDEC